MEHRCVAAGVQPPTVLITSSRSESESQSYRERTHEGYACVERSTADGIEQRPGRCHKRHATAHGPERPHVKQPLSRMQLGSCKGASVV
eukprot:53602-Chlamydomonas_euryale.AAC.5